MISIIDYDAGNLRSVSNALKSIGVNFNIAAKAGDFNESSGIILPGVGAAPGAMKSLADRRLVEPLKEWRRPLLGICLGMQLMFERSEEGDTECLGLLNGVVKKFDENALRVPHMGWNRVQCGPSRWLPSGQNAYFYFAHSYYVPLSGIACGISDSGIQFSAAVQSANLYGVQFHPEKSGVHGLQLLRSFVQLCESFRP